MIEKIFILIACHLVGDYVLQTRFIAESKGTNWYHLFVHCVLYSVPFHLAFGWCWQLGLIFGSHFLIDPCKARYGVISYPVDQILHYLIALAYLI